MNAQLQRCDSCQKINADNQEGWVRLLGGAVKSGQPPRQSTLDFCPSCAASKTIAQAPDFMPQLQSPQALRPTPVVTATTPPQTK